MEAIIGLVGVVIGGFLSYFTQAAFQEETEKRNDLRNKHIAYNKFLLLEGQKSPLVVPIHHVDQKEFRSEIYREGTRNVLFENLHLFDKKVVMKVLEIDYLEEVFQEYDDSQEITDSIYDHYFEIVKLIKDDYEKDLEKPN